MAHAKFNILHNIYFFILFCNTNEIMITYFCGKLLH